MCRLPVDYTFAAIALAAQQRSKWRTYSFLGNRTRPKQPSLGLTTMSEWCELLFSLSFHTCCTIHCAGDGSRGKYCEARLLHPCPHSGTIWTKHRSRHATDEKGCQGEHKGERKRVEKGTEPDHDETLVEIRKRQTRRRPGHRSNAAGRSGSLRRIEETLNYAHCYIFVSEGLRCLSIF